MTVALPVHPVEYWWIYRMIVFGAHDVTTKYTTKTVYTFYRTRYIKKPYILLHDDIKTCEPFFHNGSFDGVTFTLNDLRDSNEEHVASLLLVRTKCWKTVAMPVPWYATTLIWRHSNKDSNPVVHIRHPTDNNQAISWSYKDILTARQVTKSKLILFCLKSMTFEAIALEYWLQYWLLPPTALAESNTAQYIPWNIYTVRILLCSMMANNQRFYPYYSGLLQWHGATNAIPSVSEKLVIPYTKNASRYNMTWYCTQHNHKVNLRSQFDLTKDTDTPH